MSFDFSKQKMDLTTTENEMEDQLDSLSKSYNDLLFLQSYSSILSLQKENETQEYLNQTNLSLEIIQKATGNMKLEEITNLDLSNLKLCHFKSSVSINLTGICSLENLFLAGNNLASLGEIIFMFGLKKLDVSNNNLTSLLGIDALESLKMIDVSGNKLMALSHIRDMPKLKTLNVSRNKIENLDQFIIDLKSLPKLATLNCQKNPIAFDYFYKNELLVQLARLQFLNAVKLSESDFEIARIFFRHFQNSKAKIEEKEESEEDEETKKQMCQSDFFGKKGFASKLRILAKKERKRNPDLEKMMEHKSMLKSTGDFKKKEEPDIFKSGKKNIKTRVLKNHELENDLNEKGLQNKILELEKLLGEKNKEIESLIFENSVLKVEMQSTGILIEQNKILNDKIAAIEKQDFGNDCKSVKCKETQELLTRKFQDCFSEVIKLKIEKESRKEDEGIELGSTSLANLNKLQNQESGENDDEDFELEKALKESLTKINEAKVMLREFKRSENSGELGTGRIELKPVKKPSGLLKSRTGLAKMKEVFGKKG